MLDREDWMLKPEERNNLKAVVGSDIEDMWEEVGHSQVDFHRIGLKHWAREIALQLHSDNYMLNVDTLSYFSFSKIMQK